ncbi:DMT family transporter [Andreprevotia chitinilytica]|uniref:DMT family transporter n=1 Tax=Andreprevotia chitinilytica TaxID=396808 RepID=UPI000A73163F|nr:DMT family transporter [Andreprevotia chitinilytica]
MRSSVVFSWSRLRDSGPFWMAVAGLCFGVMGVFVKLGSVRFSTAELVFYRCLAGFAGILLIVLPQGLSVAVKPAMLKLHLTRSISGFISLMLYFYAIAHLPLPTAVTLNYTSPIFLLLLTLGWQRQWPQRSQVLAVLFGFVGVVLLLRPTFNEQDYVTGLIGLGSGLLASVAYMNVHELGRAGEPDWRTVFYFSLVSSIGAGIWMLFQSTPLTRLTWSNLWIIIGLGFAATCAQLSMTRAYRKGKSLVVASFAYLTVVFSTLFGVLIWGDVLPPSSYLAMLLIASTGVLTTLVQRRN